MKPSSSKAKGRRLQDKVRKKILEFFPQLEPGDVKCAVMGESGEDIKFSPLGQKTVGISIECKKRKSFAIYKDYDQAVSNCGAREPVLIIEADRRKPLAVLDLDYYLSLVSRGDK